jgi:hypothetical protein
MLYANHSGHVSGNPDGQAAMVYLVSSIKRVSAAGLPYVFTDGHADVQFTSFFDDVADMTVVDWSVVDERYWADTQDDPDKKRRKQAEFLVYRFLPWTLLRQITVIDAAMEARVNKALTSASASLTVAIDRTWYY